MLRHKLSGVGAAMITPFTADGRVDYKALARMIDYVIDGGVDSDHEPRLLLCGP